MYMWCRVSAERLEEIKTEKTGNRNIEIESDRVIDEQYKIIYYTK